MVMEKSCFTSCRTSPTACLWSALQGGAIDGIHSDMANWPSAKPVRATGTVNHGRSVNRRMGASCPATSNATCTVAATTMAAAAIHHHGQ